jgi:hypothetical protein
MLLDFALFLPKHDFVVTFGLQIIDSLRRPNHFLLKMPLVLTDSFPLCFEFVLNVPILLVLILIVLLYKRGNLPKLGP